MEPQEPLSSFHLQSLSFSLDDLETLTSAQLALVQFHPEASDLQGERAKVLFLRRRLEEQGQEGTAVKGEELVQHVGAEVPIKQEDREEEDVKPAIKVEGEERVEEAKVKRKVEEVSLLDDDDDEVVITQGGRRAAPAKKRKSDPIATSSSLLTVKAAPAKKRHSDPGDGTTSSRLFKGPR
ncbi:hypothetical protein JCM11251_004194 [Rhodosporidiobolus azoricus]